MGAPSPAVCGGGPWSRSGDDARPPRPGAPPRHPRARGDRVPSASRKSPPSAAPPPGEVYSGLVDARRGGGATARPAPRSPPVGVHHVPAEKSAPSPFRQRSNASCGAGRLLAVLSPVRQDDPPPPAGSEGVLEPVPVGALEGQPTDRCPGPGPEDPGVSRDGGGEPRGGEALARRGPKCGGAVVLG